MARERKAGGGILTLVPPQAPVLQQSTGEHFVHVQLLTGYGTTLHVINTYLPPRLRDVSQAWHSVLRVLDAIPAEDPAILVGDLNARIHLS